MKTTYETFVFEKKKHVKFLRMQCKIKCENYQFPQRG